MIFDVIVLIKIHKIIALENVCVIRLDVNSGKKKINQSDMKKTNKSPFHGAGTHLNFSGHDLGPDCPEKCDFIQEKICSEHGEDRCFHDECEPGKGHDFDTFKKQSVGDKPSPVEPVEGLLKEKHLTGEGWEKCSHTCHHKGHKGMVCCEESSFCSHCEPVGDKL